MVRKPLIFPSSLADGRRFKDFGGTGILTLLAELALGFRHGVAGVVIGVLFVLRAICSNALDDEFGIVAAGKCALRVGPIVLRLAFVVT